MRFFIAAFTLFLSLACATAPAHAEWRRAISTHFIVYSEGSPAEVREAAARLERFDGLLRRLSPVPPRESPIKLTVFMPRTTDAVASLAGAGVGIAGFYRGVVAGPFMVAPRQGASRNFDADTILFHEYTHHFMLQNFSTAYPAWFVEGYAELLSTTRFERDGGITIGSFADHRARELALPVPPLRALMLRSPRELRGADRVSFYANSWFLTHYLVLADARRGQLGRYIGLVGSGRTAEQAAEEAFGGIEALQRDFLRYRGASRIPTVTIRFDQAPATGPITVEALSPGEESLLWHQARYRQGMERDDIAGFARRVRARAAQTPSDPGALQLLADVESWARNHDEASRAVDALLALRPEAPRALMRKGQIEIELLDRDNITEPARWTAARDWLRRANRADPDDPLILLLYYRSFERQGGRPPANAVAGLARAFELVPQDFSVRGRYAGALIRARRYSEAVTVLAPIAYSAHAGAAGERAARTIDAIRGLADGAQGPVDQAPAGPPDEDPNED
jgi:hypothetical protein